MAPKLIFGTATFGMDLTEFQEKDSVESLLTALHELGIESVNTGARYPPLNPGRSESLIGEARGISRTFSVDTKVFTDTQTDGSGDLSKAAMSSSVNDSLDRLQRPEGVNVLYAHRADPRTPLKEQVQNFNDQIRQGHCKAWGVSNTPLETFEKILQICDKHGWKKPSVYQGNYNLVTRGVESTLLPLLRAHNISFYGYGPLAAGFLTGNFVNDVHDNTRFADDNPLGKLIRSRFSADDLLGSMKKFDAEVKAQGLTPKEVAIRWVVYHSSLEDDDGVIFGASRVSQAVETVQSSRRGPLPESIVALTEELWNAVRSTRSDLI